MRALEPISADSSAFQQVLRFRFEGIDYADMERRCGLLSRMEETPRRTFSQPFS